MKVSATLNNLRIAPRKTRLVGELIKGLDVQEALNQLDNQVKGACPHLHKLVKSAIANGENNFGIDRDNMYIFDIVIDAGPTLKRWMPKAFGRAGRILKRTSNVTVVLEERVEGKGRKSKEQIEKERKARLEEKKKVEKERLAEREQADKEKSLEAEPTDKVEKIEKAKAGSKDKVKEAKKGGWAKKVFQRKSM